MFKNDLAFELDIQKFANTADNDSEENTEVEDSVNTDNAGGEELEFVDGASGEEVVNTEESQTVEETDKKISTKAFSNRLNREKEKLERELAEKKKADLDNIAKTKGFENWEDFEKSHRRENLEKIGIADEDAFTSLVNDAVMSNPTVVEAQRVIEAQREREQKAVLDAAINEISSIDPDVNSIDDLLSLDNYDGFYDLVEKGYSLPDAYKIISFDKISSKKAASAAQNVINNISSKGHITTTKGTQTKEITVPDEVLNTYRKNNPDMTEDEIRKHYSKFVGGVR